MAIYYFAVAFQSDDTVSDGTHHDAQYGFAVDSGDGPAALGSSGPNYQTFESVPVPAATGNQQNQFVVTVCSDILQINQTSSFVRVSFRPAHDVQPASNLPLAPVNQANAQALLTGFALGDTDNVTERVQITNGTKFGLPKDGYATQWFLPASPFVSGQRQGTSLHFELSIEVAILVGTAWSYYKIDPEMQIDF